MVKWMFYFFSLSFILGCNNQIPINDIQNIPNRIPEDEPFAKVYHPLDGTWKGDFQIFEDTVRNSKAGFNLRNISHATLDQLPLKLVNTIQVTQYYESENPYFQRVKIEDFYPDKGETVVSKGVNKIQGGEMWCVVQKPDELIIHKGSSEPNNTIIWQRNESSPQRIEYFKETVQTNTYEIVGWGYYEGDDPSLMPKFWFYSAYQRQ